MLVEQARNPAVAAMAARPGERFALVGKGWEKMDIKAASAGSGIPGAGRRRAMQDHTWDQRMARLVQAVDQTLWR